MSEKIVVHYPVDEEGRVKAARRIEELASIATAAHFDVDLDAFVFLMPTEKDL